MPAFTYSRKKNRFYDISGAAFADELPCGLTYSIEDFFLMAGGALLPGQVDNQILSQYLPDFDPFFDCFLQFRRDWPNIISYIQRISPRNTVRPAPVRAGRLHREGRARLPQHRQRGRAAGSWPVSALFRIWRSSQASRCPSGSGI